MFTPDLVSIITPAYNSAATIQATIDSVVAQTYKNWEMLVVIDSGTKDSTPQIVEASAKTHPQIRLVVVPEGKGLALSRNFALKQAKGQFVAFLDSDDLWLPAKLEKQVRAIKLADATMAAHAFRRLSFDGKKAGRLLSVPKLVTYNDLLKNNVIGCLTVLIDQSKSGPLQFLETKHEDYLLWLQILKQGHKCIGVQEDLARYRIVPASRSANKMEMAKVRWKILRQHEHLGLAESLYYLSQYTFLAFNKYWRF